MTCRCSQVEIATKALTSHRPNRRYVTIVRFQPSNSRLLIAIATLLWAVSGVWSSAYATTEALAHSGEDHQIVHHSETMEVVDTGALDDGPAEKKDHEHPGDALCGPCHAHALRVDEIQAFSVMEAPRRLRPIDQFSIVMSSPNGLFRPPRV